MHVAGRSVYMAVVLALLLSFAGAQGPATAQDPSDGGWQELPSWPDAPDWERYVPGPDSDDVTPVAITRAHSGATNADALVAGDGAATLTVEEGDESAVIVVDYGQNVGGTPYIDVESTSGPNAVRLSTSEALPFLNTDRTTSLAQDATAGDSVAKVNSVTPFFTGTPITFGTGDDAETATITDVGTVAAPGTSLVLDADAGVGTVHVASTGGYAVGAPLAIGAGADRETATITAVGSSAGAPTELTYPADAGATNVKVPAVSGFGVGEPMLVGGEVVTATDVGTFATTTNLFRAATAGDTNLAVTSVAGLTVGAEIDVEPGPGQDHVTITDVGTPGANTAVAASNTTEGLPVPALSGANWIWNVANANSSTPPGTIHLRKTFEVADPSAVGSAVLRINADDGHVTYVNGTQVSSSGSANNSWQTSQINDISSLLVAGTNVIAIAPFNSGSAGSVIGVAEIDGERIVTDGSWMALPGTPATPPAGWNAPGFDDSSWQAANVSGPYGSAPWNSNVQNPPGPTTLRVDSTAGFAAGERIVVEPGPNAETRTISAVSGGNNPIITVTEPFSIAHAVDAPVLNLDRPGTGIDVTPALANDHGLLGTVASPGTGVSFEPALAAAYPAGTLARGAGSGIDFEPVLDRSHAAGEPVSSSGTGVSFTPALTTDHAAGSTVSGTGRYVNDSGGQINFTVDEPGTYTGNLRGGFRFLAIELRSPGTVTLSGTGLNFKAYRATPAEYEGWFVSSDDQLNRMWYAGAYTAQLDMVPPGVEACFDQPVIFDGAKRDRAIWSGDLIISDPVALLSLGSNAAPYVTGSIDAFVDLQEPSGRLTSAVGFRGCGAFNYAVTYSAYAAIIAVQYYRYTGDTAYITDLLPNLEAATAYSESRLDANGLIVTNDNDYWQTRQNGEVTEYSLAYYELLTNMIWLESQVGTQEQVDEYTADAAALKEAINARLFNTDVNLYQHTDTRPNVYPLDANMNAVRLGVAPTDQVDHILDYFRDAWVEHGSEISQPSPSMTDPYGHTIEPLNNTWEMLARLRSNDAAGALELMRRLWGLQVDPDSGYFTNTFWEFVMEDGLPDRGFDSLAHAWGAGPTQVLTEAVIGAGAVDPGYETWVVQPQPTDIEWARGQVPTPHGPLLVSWAQDPAAGAFQMVVDSPDGTSGEVWVPLQGRSVGEVAAPAAATFLREEDGHAVYAVGSGSWRFVVWDGATPVCIDPDPSPTVVIDGIDTGVDNVVVVDVCTIDDLIDDEGTWTNHGTFVRHVGDVTADLVDRGVLTGRERGRIVSAAARARIGRSGGR